LEGREMSSVPDNEAFYDAEIAPALDELSKQCYDRGMPFNCAVEWAPGKIGHTQVKSPDQSLESTMIGYCMQTAPNLDSYVLGIIKYCNQYGINVEGTLVAHMLTRNVK
jgi:hypothetical protein